MNPPSPPPPPTPHPSSSMLPYATARLCAPSSPHAHARKRLSCICKVERFDIFAACRGRLEARPIRLKACSRGLPSAADPLTPRARILAPLPSLPTPPPSSRAYAPRRPATGRRAVIDPGERPAGRGRGPAREAAAAPRRWFFCCVQARRGMDVCGPCAHLDACVCALMLCAASPASQALHGGEVARCRRVFPRAVAAVPAAVPASAA